MKNKKLTIIIFIILVLLFGVFFYFNKPGQSKFLPVCPLNYLTGIYCPVCGTTRMIYALLHLDIITAIRCNVFMFAVSLVLMYSIFVRILKKFSKNRLILYDVIKHPCFTRVIIITSIVFTVLRNIPIMPFLLLAPVSLH